MGLVDKAKALVPWASSDSDKDILEEQLNRTREDLESWKEEAQDFKQRYLSLQEQHQDLQDDLRRVERERDQAQDKLQDLKQRIDKSIEKDLESDTGREDLTNREKQLYKLVRNNGDRIQSQSDVLDLMKRKHGVDWKQSTLKVNLSRIKSKGYGDLRTHWK
jgi:septal ring factor EnvC (AmiA/AmiB activator)